MEIESIKKEQVENLIKTSGLKNDEIDIIQPSYQPFFIELAKLQEESKKINYENPSIIDEKVAREIRLQIVKIRTGSMKVKDERKQIHLLRGNVEQSFYNLIKSTCELAEKTLSDVEKVREIAEAKRREELNIQRIEECKEYAEFIPIGLKLGDMDEDSYFNIYNGARLQKEAKIKAEAEAEKLRIETELKREIYEQRKTEMAKKSMFVSGFEINLNTTDEEYNKIMSEAEKRESNYREEQERIRLENERLKLEAIEKEKALQAERDKVEAERKAQEEKQRKELEEQKRIQAIKDAEIAKERAIQEAKLKAEQEAKAKLEAALRAKQEAENKAKKEAEEKAAAELRAKQEAEMKAKAAPDKEKLLSLATIFENIKLPEMGTNVGIKIIEDVKTLQIKLINFIKDKANLL